MSPDSGAASATRVAGVPSAILIGVTSVSAALAARLVLNQFAGSAVPLITPVAATAVAQWFGGRRVSIPVALGSFLGCLVLLPVPAGQSSLGLVGGPLGLAAFLFTAALIIAFGEATRGTERERASQLQTARLAEAIIRSSDDAIIRKRLDGIIETWNPGAERLFGHAAADAVGRHISLIIPADRIAEE